MNKELDYVNVIKFQNDEELLNLHWLNCIETSTWYSVDSTKKTFDKLSTSHLCTIIKMLNRFNTQKPREVLQRLINVLVDELSNRTDM